MNLFDKLALAGRRYEIARVPRNQSTQFTLGDTLEFFNFNTILELTPVVNGKSEATLRPDAVRKLKVSLLDGISAIHSHNDDWFEVYRTAPSGDLTRVRIVAHSRSGEKIGELQMLVSQRLPIYYFGEDPILDEILKR
ncbi:MAG: hypothetical protein AB7P33_04570 [Dehalococcoidia bacterium]